MKRSAWIVLLVISAVARPAWAVREGWGNGKILAEQFERKGQWQKAALWRDAMAVTLEFVSKPLAEDMLKRARKTNDFREVRQLQRDLAQIEELIQSTRKKAAENRVKAAKDEQGIDLEKKRIESYIDSFLQHYPHAMVSTWGLEKM